MHSEDERTAAVGAARRFDRLVGQVQAPSCVRQERGAGGGEGRAAGRPFEELSADDSFEMTDLFADCGLADHEQVGGPSEAAFTFDGDEDIEIAKLKGHR